MYGYFVLRKLSAILGFVISCFIVSSAYAACAPDALGTSRTMSIDTSKFRLIEGNEKNFGLRHKEVILTFDDGPVAGKTSRILKVLKKECVKATFFYVGQMAKANPKLVRRVVAHGHTLAHHTYSHNRLPSYSSKKVAHHIDRGIKTLQKIAYGKASTTPRIRFFRYPYFARNSRTDRVIAKKGLIAFGANIDALDWKKRSTYKIRKHIMRQLRRDGKGIILMHDIHGRTAKMLPGLLEDLKEGGYRVVHMVPTGYHKPAPKLRGSPQLVASLEAPISEHISDVKKAISVVVAAHMSNSPPLDSRIIKASTSRDVSRSGVKVGNTRADEGDKNNVGAVSKPSRQKTKKQPLKKLTKLKRLKRKRIKKRANKSKKRRRLVIVAGGKRRRGKTNVARGGWKLRRSQWILN